MEGEFKVAVVKLRLGLFGNAVRLTRIPGLTVSKLMFGLHLENSLKIANNSYRSTSQLSIPIHNTKREMRTDCYFVGRMSTTKLQSVDLTIQVSLWIIIEM